MASNSRAILDRLTGLHPKVIDLSLGRIERLLDRLDRPQHRLPPVVHVAGTNGKGSVVAFLRAMLEAAGLEVHVYTSPHLVRFTERIVVAGREIDDARLADILEECEEVNAGAPITFFEITTAAAFLAFARTPADVTLLETGLGGRLDATNVVGAPALTAITPISLDHQVVPGGDADRDRGRKGRHSQGRRRLPFGRAAGRGGAGDPRPRIAARRAAVRGGERLVGSQGRGRGARLPRRRRRASPAGAGTRGGASVAERRLGHRLRASSAGAADGGQRCDRPRPAPRPLAGAPAAPGARARFRRSLPAGWELWLDGGHNPGAAAVLARHLEGWRDRPLFLVFGMLKSKHAGAFLSELAPLVERVATVPVPEQSASLAAEEAARIAARHGIVATAATSVADALALLAAEGGPPARVLICGSLYLAGAVLAANDIP